MANEKDSCKSEDVLQNDCAKMNNENGFAGLSEDVCLSKDDCSVVEETVLSNDRLIVNEKIAQLEKDGKFDQDVEDDPETIVLLPDQIDYINKKLSSKIKTKFANFAGNNFFKKMIKEKQVLLAEPIGLENLEGVKGAILTCNHFNPFDNYALYLSIKSKLNKKMLWKVIREGNYTNPPAPFGFFMRNCNTLPLSSNKNCLKKFLEGVAHLLKKGEKILIYPEQAMWWNYKKPRPLKNGAFKMAVKNNVPVVPCFITLKDTNLVDKNSAPVLEYCVNVLKPIYADKELSLKENVANMMNENYEMWKDVYESFYKIPLVYNNK